MIMEELLQEFPNESFPEDSGYYEKIDYRRRVCEGHPKIEYKNEYIGKNFFQLYLFICFRCYS